MLVCSSSLNKGRCALSRASSFGPPAILSAGDLDLVADEVKGVQIPPLVHPAIDCMMMHCSCETRSPEPTVIARFKTHGMQLTFLVVDVVLVFCV